MAVDIAWYGLVEKYIQTGKQTDLEQLLQMIRENGVPKELGNQIADLLAGKLKPDYSSNELKSYDKKQFYDVFLSLRKHIKSYESMFFLTVKLGIETIPDSFNVATYNKQLFHKMFAKEFCNGNIETAKKFINRKINSGEWPNFPE